MHVIEITDVDDARIAPYRDIRERDLVGRDGCFIAEGKIVLGVLLSSFDYRAESVLVLRRRVGAVEPLLSNYSEVAVFIVDDDIMDRVAGFHVHRGILALGRRKRTTTPEALLQGAPEDALVAVCMGISNHDNIGSIFRNAAAFGCSGIFLDPTCCDPLYRKALRVSVGGVLKVPFARFGDVSELQLRLSAAGFRQLALSPSGAIDIENVDSGGRTAIYLGSEGDGLPPSLMSAMSTVRIPISTGFDSLNVAAASAIALHRLRPG